MMTGWLLLPSVLALISQGNACGSRESVLVLVSKKPVRLKDPNADGAPAPSNSTSGTGRNADGSYWTTHYTYPTTVEGCTVPSNCLPSFIWVGDGSVVKGCTNPFYETPWCAMRVDHKGWPTLRKRCICKDSTASPPPPQVTTRRRKPRTTREPPPATTRKPPPLTSRAPPEPTTEAPRTEDWRQAALEAHNRFRALHHAPPLELDESLNAEGTQWAQHLIKKFGCNPKCKMEHSHKGLGENIAAMWGNSGVKCGKDVGVRATNMWYNELKNEGYNFDNPPPVTDFHKTGHFTQVVWKETRKMGIGCADDENGYFVVANYKPRGNMQSQEAYRKNVLPK